jgi:hypothetical protein
MFSRNATKINLLSRNRIDDRFLYGSLPGIHITPGSTKYNSFK